MALHDPILEVDNGNVNNGIVDGGNVNDDDGNDARSMASDVSTIFGGATDETSCLLRGYQRQMSAAIRAFVATHDVAKLGDEEDDEAFEFQQDANQRHQQLVSGA